MSGHINRLITGTNKNGKTNFAVAEIDAWLAAFPESQVFTNIKGLKDTTPRCHALPESNDWRDTPPGSLVVYDEAQEFPWMEATGRSGNSEDERIKRLATSAHETRAIWFITQNPTLIHHHIRKFINEHVHLVRILGMQASTKWSWHERVCISPDDFHEQQKADKSVFMFRKDLYGRYVGASDGHRVKVRLPKKVVLLGGAALVVLGLVVWKIASGGVFFLRSDGQAAEAEKSGGGFLGIGGSAVGGPGVDLASLPYPQRFKPAVDFQPWTAPAYQQLQPVGVPAVLCTVSGDGLDSLGNFSEGTCRCYTEQATLLEEYPDPICRKYALHPPYNPFKPAPVVAASLSPPLPAASDSPALPSSGAFLDFPASGSAGPALAPDQVRQFPPARLGVRDAIGQASPSLQAAPR